MITPCTKRRFLFSPSATHESPCGRPKGDTQKSFKTQVLEGREYAAHGGMPQCHELVGAERTEIFPEKCVETYVSHRQLGGHVD